MSRRLQTLLHHPIIVVTGANSGLGFATCLRLLAQLSRPSPSDVHSGDNLAGAPHQQSPFAPTKQLTLVLACRNVKRANTARSLLLEFLDAEISRQKKSANYNGHAEEFRRGLNIDFLPLDLASMDSVFECAKEARRQYPYISHLILNAGVCEIIGFDWYMVIWQFLAGPVDAVTRPRYLIQPVGFESHDGLGLVWQSNVFGHYCLARLMEPLLHANPYLDSRVEWVSSLDTEDADPSDPQLRQTKSPYQESKYQIDLIATVLAQVTTKDVVQEDQARISHLIVHPGVCHTNLTFTAVGLFMLIGKIISFYMARVLGSQNHLVKPYKSAIVAVHASLAPAPVLRDAHINAPPKLGARCTLFGREYVDIEHIPNWEGKAAHAEDLVRYCEKMFLTFAKARGDTPPSLPTDRNIEVRVS